MEFRVAPSLADWDDLLPLLLPRYLACLPNIRGICWLWFGWLALCIQFSRCIMLFLAQKPRNSNFTNFWALMQCCSKRMLALLEQKLLAYSDALATGPMAAYQSGRGGNGTGCCTFSGSAIHLPQKSFRSRRTRLILRPTAEPRTR